MFEKIGKALTDLFKNDNIEYNFKMKRTYYRIIFNVYQDSTKTRLCRANLSYRFHSYNDKFDENRVKETIASQFKTEREAIEIKEVFKH